MGLQLITTVSRVNQELLSGFPRAPVSASVKIAVDSAITGFSALPSMEMATKLTRVVPWLFLKSQCGEDTPNPAQVLREGLDPEFHPAPSWRVHNIPWYGKAPPFSILIKPLDSLGMVQDIRRGLS